MYAPQNPPPVHVEEAPFSGSYLRIKSLDAWAFRGITFSIGLVATNVIRLFPAYYWLYVLVSVLGISALLLFSPADIKSVSLWRSGAIALLGGLILPWWEILSTLPIWVWMAIPVGLIAILTAIGGHS